MTTKYDSSILQVFADDLYDKASTAVIKATVIWLLLGALAGGGLSYWVKPADTSGAAFLIGITALAFSIYGYMVGTARAFKFRLEAQNTLCQVAIERNTAKENRP